MRCTRIMLFQAVVCGLMLTGVTQAQQGDSTGEGQELNKTLSELMQEIKSLKKEVKGMRADLAKALVAMRSAAKKPAKRQRPAMTMIGKKLPKQSLTTIDGKTTSIGGKRDKPQVVFCYASWCGYCKKSLPWMESLHQKYKDKGVEVLALNLDARGEGRRARTEAQTLEHFEGLNLTLPMTMTTASNDTKKIGSAYKAKSFPTIFVLGTSGEVEFVHVGAKAGLANTIGKELDLLLQGKTRAHVPK